LNEFLHGFVYLRVCRDVISRNRNSGVDDHVEKGLEPWEKKDMDRKFILIPAFAVGIFLAQSAQQRVEALNAPTVTIGQYLIR
jgi:hypothetical protein